MSEPNPQPNRPNPVRKPLPRGNRPPVGHPPQQQGAYPPQQHQQPQQPHAYPPQGSYGPPGYPPQQGGYGAPQPYGRPHRGRHMAPHRGTTILVLLVCGWFLCAICSIVAAVMAKGDLREIDAGRMDPSGRDMIKICYYIAIGHLCFIGAIFALYAVMAVFLVAAR